MLTRTHLEFLAVLVVIAGLWFGVKSWRAQREARETAEATVQQNAKVAQVAGDQVKALQGKIDARDAAEATLEQNIRTETAAAKTPAQIDKYIQARLAPGESIGIPAPTAANPLPAAEIEIPQADLPALRDQMAECELDKTGLSECQAVRLDEAAKEKAAGEKLSAVSKERDAYKQELAGGTFWKRTKKGAEFIGFGLAAGIAVTCGSGHCKK
jgi:hypothetical protein